MLNVESAYILIYIVVSISAIEVAYTAVTKRAYTGDLNSFLAMKNKGILELEGMEFHARHGCLEREKIAENLFTVDFRAETDMSAAAESDRLEDALDYGRIYDIVKKEMSVHSDLLEHLAGRIVAAC